MSASWFLVSMYLIWILESKLIRSNDQSSATLWVLETYLIVGLLPFKVIFITASLSSNTYNKASWCENWTFERIKSTTFKSLITLWDCLRLWIVWGGEQTSRLFNKGSPRSARFWAVSPKTETIRSHRSRAGIPSNLNLASKEMISDSVELCETEVCFLHIQLIVTNVRLPKIHKIHPEVDFESSRSPAKTESWNNPIDNAQPCYPHDNTAGSHLCDECMKSILPNVCRKPESILSPLLQVYWPTIKNVKSPNTSQNTDISEQFVSRLWTILQLIHFLLL